MTARPNTKHHLITGKAIMFVICRLFLTWVQLANKTEFLSTRAFVRGWDASLLPFAVQCPLIQIATTCISAAFKSKIYKKLPCVNGSVHEI